MIVALVLALLFNSLSLVSAQSASQVVTATTEVNICGNSVVEPPAEDCEGNDLNSATCTTLGYAAGSLSCDIACSFVTTACTLTSPSPSPSPSSTPRFASPTPLFSPSPPSLPTSLPSPTIIFPQSPLPSPLNSLLTSLGITSITIPNLRPVIQTWVEAWRSPASTPRLAQCDINDDAMCNLTDLSIILYHVRP